MVDICFQTFCGFWGRHISTNRPWVWHPHELKRSQSSLRLCAACGPGGCCMDWFSRENVNRKPMGFHHQIWWAFLLKFSSKSNSVNVACHGSIWINHDWSHWKAVFLRAHSMRPDLSLSRFLLTLYWKESEPDLPSILMCFGLGTTLHTGPDGIGRINRAGFPATCTVLRASLSCVLLKTSYSSSLEVFFFKTMAVYGRSTSASFG